MKIKFKWVIKFDFFFTFQFFVWKTKWATEFKIMMNSITLLHCKSCVDINVGINFSPEIVSGSVDFYFLYETKVFVDLPIIHCISCSFDVTSFHNVFYQQTG